MGGKNILVKVTILSGSVEQLFRSIRVLVMSPIPKQDPVFLQNLRTKPSQTSSKSQFSCNLLGDKTNKQP